MKRLCAGFLLAGAAALGAAACTNSSKPGTPAGEPTATPTKIVQVVTGGRATYTVADAPKLIYWQELGAWGPSIPPQALDILADLTAIKEDEVIPYLLDLAALPGPYRFQVRETLTAWLGDDGGFEVFGWIEQQGFKRPADDTPEYLAFKRKLIETIQPEMAQFLSLNDPRTISAQEILWGGVFIDTIPPLEHPHFVTPAQARSWIFDADQVIGVEINGDARAYPRRIIDWHEMVNDTVGGVPVSLAYCTLCGSAILYDGRVGERVFDFGTSGLLYRSNKLMYDRQTRTLWEQYTGVPVWGPLVGTGIELKVLPVVHTSWGEWLRDHPDTKVLDINTGFARDYNPGVAYAEYWATGNLMFPAPDRSGPLAPKETVYAVRLGDALTAYPIRVLARRGFIQDSVGGEAVVVLTTPEASGARAYRATGVTFTAYDRDARTATTSDGRRWRLEEEALVADDGARLERVPGHNSFWFSVTNHTENGRLYEE